MYVWVGGWVTFYRLTLACMQNSAQYFLFPGIYVHVPVSFFTCVYVYLCMCMDFLCSLFLL